MFAEAEKISFLKQGHFPSLEGKQANRCLILKIDKQDKIVVKYKAELEDVYSMKEALTETVTNQNQTISELNQKLNSCEVQLKN